MRSARSRFLVVPALVAGFAACADGDGRSSGSDAASVVDTVAAVPAAPPSSSAAPAGESDGVIGVRVEQPRPRELTVHGATASADSVVQVSVEDGHRILFGPADVAVRDGRFRIDFAHEPSDRPAVFVYVGDPAGRHQTVVPVATQARAAAAGPSVDAAPPPLDSVPMGDGRTAASAEGLESPSFRVRWPRVSPGDPRVTVEGEARVARFAVAVVRGDSTVAVRPVAAEEPVDGWRRFAVTLPVAGGFRADDAVALLTGPDSRELFFQPVRN